MPLIWGCFSLTLAPMDRGNQSGTDSEGAGLTWLGFAMLTVCCFGVYGNFLHSGQLGMADPVNGRFKAFLFVGAAYFLVAVLAPLGILLAKKAPMHMTIKGMFFSFLAGSAGAVGAFGILLALGNGGTPAVVMSIVFAGAPIVNAIYSMITHPPEKGLSALKPQFYLGILLAALGGALVTLNKPSGAAKPADAPATAKEESHAAAGSTPPSHLLRVRL